MKKHKKLLSVLLCLALTFTMVTVGITAYAQDSNGTTGEKETRDGDTGTSSSGMEISKTATANRDGTYTIQLEAYATGSKVITEVTEDVPTDIVLVLDQSGSMDDPIGTVSFEEYSSSKSTNSRHFERRHNGGSANLWYKLDDESYASVSVNTKSTLDYKELRTGLKNYTSELTWDGVQLTTDCYYYYKNNLYEKVEGEYKQVSLTREWISTGLFGGYYKYTYTFFNGDSITSDDNGTVPPLNSHEPLYTVEVDDTKTVYTYTYTDKSGVTHTIGTSTGANTTFATTLYQRSVNSNGGGSRLNALKNAVTTFSNNVAEKAAGQDGRLGTEDDVNHRIAVVGYASRADSNNPWINTEVFIGANQYNYNVNAKSYYNSAFQDMNTTQGQSNVTASIGALDANGATYTNYGLEMANGILDAYPVAPGELRNRVIILFTDGYPGKNADDFNEAAANAALAQAKSAKDSGVSLYSVGIFNGADATTTGDKNGTNTEAANWFMQQVSSNNGTPQNPSYYLSAADADTLNNIFQQISDQIESGGSSTTLGEETVIKDIIAPAFTLPAGTTEKNIQINTYECTGKKGDNYSWSSESSGNDDASATVNGDQVSVTGFDFAKNYVGTETAADGKVTYRGKKLVISFTVSPKDGFLGGNNVYTNTKAGVYENSDATEQVLEFNRPQVNVPIKAVNVTAADKNVYLLGDLTGEQLKNGANVTVGGVLVDLSKAKDTDKPYGLEPWQTEYVNIAVEIKDAGGETITKLTDLQDDTTYAVSVTVAPTYDGNGADGTLATKVTGTNNPDAKINVFKPELKFQDSTAYYGESVPANNDFSSNYVADYEKWKNGEKYSTDDDVKMLGAKPTLGITYEPDGTKLENNMYTKQDVPVKAIVQIGSVDVTNYTTFRHQDCDPACTWETPTKLGNPAFMIHIQTCQLTITKVGGAGDEPYVFTVYKNSEAYTEASITGNGSVTIYELPVGDYTIEEDTGWSWRWRFAPTYSNNAAITLGSGNPTGEITCTNTREKPYWLNGFSTVVKNVFEKANN